MKNTSEEYLQVVRLVEYHFWGTPINSTDRVTPAFTWQNMVKITHFISESVPYNETSILRPIDERCAVELADELINEQLIE